ncbi:uncharacterized protein LOC117114712 isoform X2 [Anneissia japonica]|uniref:uncharacterized protein LOC117114712 isoform X2 n=1 Tax=Anneissia japonica TaxID=1529436 RepID=UPI0014255E2A|nr:uncharacterized protein LOC117114712 isoform X2 [Anneissia japonica]
MEGFKYSEEVQQGSGEGDVIVVPDLSEKSQHWVFAQSATECLSEEKPYFTVNIIELAKDATVAIGIGSENYLDSEDNDDEETPHSKKKKFAMAYFSDDGSIANPARSSASEIAPTYKKGDNVAMLLDYADKKRALVSFLKNEEVVFRQWMKKDILLPTINVWWGPAELSVTWSSKTSLIPQFDCENLSQWSMPDFVSVDDDTFHMKSSSGPAALQSPCPFLEDSYYEITLLNMGEDVKLGPVIGLTSAFIEDDELPGRTTGAIGYSAVDGAVMCETKFKAQKLGNEAMCKTNDVIGLGLIFADKNLTDRRLEQPVVVYFTHNGEVLCHQCFEQPTGGFYATIGLAAQGSVVQVNMKATSPDTSDEEAWIREALKPKPLLFTVEIPKPTADHTHEEGETTGLFRYHEQIGPPTGQEGSIIKPVANLLSNWKLIQLQKSMTPDEPNFTMKITDAGEESFVSMGVSRSKQTVGMMPGRLIGTAGYFSEGKIIQNGNGRCDAIKFSSGDVIGCCVEYFSSKQVLHFTNNDQLVGKAIISGSEFDLFPCIAFRGEPCTVQVMWPKTKQPVHSFDQTNFSNWLKSSELTVQKPQIFVEKKKRKLKPYTVRSPLPLCKDWKYFEVKVNGGSLPSFDQELINAPAVALTNDMSNRIFKHLSSDKDSRYVRFGFRTKSFYWRNELELLEKDMSKDETMELQSYIKCGDTIGFGVLYSSAIKAEDGLAEQAVMVYCCVNGNIVFHKPVMQPVGGFYPAVTLYKKGDKMTIDHMHKPPVDELSSDWATELETWAEQVMAIRKSQEPKLTKDDRRRKEAEEVTKPQNHLNKIEVYIHCDKPRYTETTHIKAGLDTLGFQTSLLKNLVTGKESDIAKVVQSSDAVVFCLGPEVVQSQSATLLVRQARECGKPVIPVCLDNSPWPPEGAVGDQLKLLTAHKIDISDEHYEWSIEQIGKLLENLNGKGFNGREIVVNEREAAKIFYTDAQTGNETENKPSDPEAFKRAVEDADRMNATSFGNSNIREEPPIIDERNHAQPKSKTCSIL